MSFNYSERKIPEVDEDVYLSVLFITRMRWLKFLPHRILCIFAGSEYVVLVAFKDE